MDKNSSFRSKWEVYSSIIPLVAPNAPVDISTWRKQSSRDMQGPCSAWQHFLLNFLFIFRSLLHPSCLREGRRQWCLTQSHNQQQLAASTLVEIGGVYFKLHKMSKSLFAFSLSKCRRKKARDMDLQCAVGTNREIPSSSPVPSTFLILWWAGLTASDFRLGIWFLQKENALKLQLGNHKKTQNPFHCLVEASEQSHLKKVLFFLNT